MNLNQVTVYTNKPTETAEFYKKLGLKIIVDSLPRYARFECPDGVSTLSVHCTDSELPASPIVIYFESEDIDATVEQLKSVGMSFEQEPTGLALA
jgi:predicted enzyme related to lactoylglutathione lyase